MTNTTHIQTLLEKYFEGNTSLAEEAQLKMYFTKGEVAAELLPYQPLFQFFSDAKTITLEKDFTEKLPLEKTAKVVTMNTRRNRWLLGIAASLLLLCTAGGMIYWNQQQAVDKWAAYEVTDEEEALQYTLDALKLVASKLNKGAAQAAEEVDKMGTINALLKKK